MATPTNYYFVATSGGSDTNDGRDLLGFNLSTASWTTSTKRLSQTGSFTSYIFVSGDRIYLSHAGITDALYEIASKVDNDIIELVDEISAYDETNVTSSDGPWATISNADSSISAGDAVFLAEINDGEKFDISSTLTLSASGDGTSGPIIWSGSNSQGLVDGTVILVDYTGGVSNTNRVMNVTGGTTVFQYILSNGAFSDDVSDAAKRGNGWELSVDSVVFHRCEATNNDGNGFELRAGATHVFLECYAALNGTGGQLDQGAGFESILGTTTEPVFFGCVAKNNENVGFIAATGFIIQSIISASTSSFHENAGIHSRIVINCSIFNSGGDGFFRHNNAGASVFQNNILVDNSGYGMNGDVTPELDNILILSNAFYNNSSGDIRDAAYTHRTDPDGNPLIERETRDIGGDPFVNIATDNFQLDIKKTPGLLCVASGTPKDFTGTTMTNSVDRGASFVQFVRSGTG